MLLRIHSSSKNSRLKLATVATGLLFTWSTAVNADVILDAYIGSDDHGYGDVIGSNSLFDTTAVDISLSGTLLSVDLITNFANAGLGSFTSLTNTPLSNGQGIGFGDLFLANEWTPFGSAPYLGDDSISGTDWDYGFSLDNRWSATGGTGNWYSLDDAQNGDVYLSQDFLNAGIYRNGQEVAVNTGVASAMSGQPMSWSVDAANNTVSFAFDIAGTSLENSSVIGFHWGMTCGNDVIEGAYNRVPEPGTLALLGLGLSMMLFSRRRLKELAQRAVRVVDGRGIERR